MGQQMTPDTAKLKCKNFLATLLRLASEQPAGVAQNVRALIQGLIERLLEEAKAEATKKGFCDTELAKARQDRDARRVDVEKTSAAIAKLAFVFAYIEAQRPELA